MCLIACCRRSRFFGSINLSLFISNRIRYRQAHFGSQDHQVSSLYNLEEQLATAMSDGDWDADEYDAPSTVAPVQKSLYADEDADEDVKVRDMLYVTPPLHNGSC